MQEKKQEFLHLTIQKKIQEKMEPLPCHPFRVSANFATNTE